MTFGYLSRKNTCGKRNPSNKLDDTMCHNRKDERERVRGGRRDRKSWHYRLALSSGRMCLELNTKTTSWTVNKRDNLSYFHLIVNGKLLTKRKRKQKKEKAKAKVEQAKYPDLSIRVCVCVFVCEIINVKLALTNWQSLKFNCLLLYCWIFNTFINAQQWKWKENSIYLFFHNNRYTHTHA